MPVREHDLIFTKVAPPIWLGDQIRRDGQLIRLDAALSRRLTVIHAAAGYGKTSLLSQWRRRCDGSGVEIAWLTLEADDADPGRFARYIALALAGRTREGATGADAEAAADLPPRAALSAIISILSRSPRQIVIILDDYENANTPDVASFLKALIRLAPANCHFIVATRDYPRLDQAALAAQDQLLEFTGADLGFSVAEAEAMLAESEGLDANMIQAIIARVEGWPVALQLTRLSLRRGMDPHALVEQFRGASPDLTRYLSEQVLTTLPPESQDLVTRTALFDRLTGEAVNVLCDCEDGWLRLERLERHGVLLTPTSPERTAYRYHPLFAQYLRERMARRDPALFRSLHRRAALWLMQGDDPAQTVIHAIEAQDEELLSRVLEAAGGWRLIPQGLQLTVERGLARIGRPIAPEHPRLALAEVYLRFKRGEMAAARTSYDDLVARMATANLAADIRIEIRIVGDTLADYENVPASLDDLIAREALLRTLSSSDHLVVANIAETLGAKYLEGGWLERALEPTLLARSHYQAIGSLYSELFTRFTEARVRQAQGRARDAEDILVRARQDITDVFGTRSDIAANCAAYQALLLYEGGDRAGAAALLDWALPHMERSDGWVDVYAAAYHTAAWLAAAEDRIEDARAILQRARRLAQRRGFLQLEQLAGLYELELSIQTGAALGEITALAEAADVHRLADQMANPSPPYRHVAVNAALCRARLRLLEGDVPAAITELDATKAWANCHGAARLLIEIEIVLAAAHHAAGREDRSRPSFDEAVSMAMFHGTTSPFVQAAAQVKPMLPHAIAASASTDRFRQQFLQGLAKAIATSPLGNACQGILNDAEAAILRHLSHGYSNKEIARLIGMSPDTVKYRLKSVFRKIGVNSREDAVRVSHDRGLVPGQPAAQTP